MPEPRTARERARVELTASIKQVASRHLAESGAAALSLRAVAREVGLSSSAVYRYFASRDDLLTALIIDAYDSLGAAVEKAEKGTAREDLVGRWTAAVGTVRRWAIRNPHEYALIYGSPVPGYRAPEDTIGPATRASLVVATILADAHRTGRLHAGPTSPLPPIVEADLATADAFFGGAPPDAIARSLRAWATVFGLVSFELFGQFHNVLDHPSAFFDQAIADLAVDIGITTRSAS